MKQRALAAAAPAHDGEAFASAKLEVEAGEHRGARASIATVGPAAAGPAIAARGLAAPIPGRQAAHAQ